MRNPFLISVFCLIVIVLISYKNSHGQRRKATVTGVVDGDSVYQLLPVDGIPAIRNPEFLTSSAATAQMSSNEPVMGLNIGGENRAYSLWQLDAHEIVNDKFGDLPVAVTW
jgi:hypothetical protein